MLVSVLLKEKQFFISCGPATQPASWLAHVACLRYDTALGQHIGQPIALCRTDGDKIHDWTQPLHQCVKDGEQLVVLLRREHEGQDNDHALIRPIKDSQRDEKEQQHDEEDDGAEQSEDEDNAEEESGAVDASMPSDSSDSEDDSK